MYFNSKMVVGTCANPMNRSDHHYNENVMAVTSSDREKFGSLLDGIDVLCSRCRYELLTLVAAPIPPSPPPTDEETGCPVGAYGTDSACNDDNSRRNYYAGGEMNEQEAPMELGSEEDDYESEEDGEQMTRMQMEKRQDQKDEEEEGISFYTDEEETRKDEDEKTATEEGEKRVQPIPIDEQQIKFLWKWSDARIDDTNFTTDENHDELSGIDLILAAADYLQMKEKEAAQ